MLIKANRHNINDIRMHIYIYIYIDMYIHAYIHIYIYMSPLAGDALGHRLSGGLAPRLLAGRGLHVDLYQIMFKVCLIVVYYTIYIIL